MRKADDADDSQMRAPLVPVTLAFLSGILLGTNTGLPLLSLVVVGAVSGCVALWRWKRTRSGVLALLLLWGCLGALRMAVWERHPDMRLTELLSEDPQSVTLHGVIVDDPVELFEPGEAHTAEGGEVADPDRQVCVLELRHVRVVDGPSTACLDSARHSPERAIASRGTPRVSPHHTSDDVGLHWQPIHGRVRTTILSPRELLRYGDEVLVEGQWSLVPAPGNPGQYDWRAALARQRISGLLQVKPYHGVVVLRSGHHQGARGRNPPVPALRADPDGRRFGVPNARAFGRHDQGSRWMAAVFAVRQRWERLIDETFDAHDAGLLRSLLLGQRVALDERLKEAFVNTGTIHILATENTKLHRASLAGNLTL